jgi:hypothetical protein
MSYLEILAYVSVGIISTSWVLVLVFDITKKILSRKIENSDITESTESETNE